MAYQRKKRSQEQNAPQIMRQEQSSLFASSDYETTHEQETSYDSGQSSSLSLDDQRQLATKPSFDFGQIPLYASDQANPTPIQRRPQRPLIQAQLTVGSANDNYEQEADRVAAEVVDTIHRPNPSINQQGSDAQGLEGNDTLQQAPISELHRQDEDEDIQTKASSPTVGLDGGQVSPNVERQIQSAKGSGQSLDPGLQQQMGQAMGADFSGVKIHTDSQSDQLNRSIQAKAFTTGHDVFFRQNAYNPHSKGGQELIAHELTHVVQQTGNTVQRVAQLQATPALNNGPGTTYLSANTFAIQRKPKVEQSAFNKQVELLAMLYAVATNEQPSFAQKAEQLKTATGASKLAIRGQDKIAIADKIKSMERAAFKGAIKYEGDIKQITDVVGASLVYDDLAALQTACNNMSNALQTQNLTLVRFKNRFHKPSPEEYADIMLNLQMPSGHVVELQLHLKDMKHQKDKAGAVDAVEARKRLKNWQGRRNLNETVLRKWVRIVGEHHEQLISGHGIYKMKRADQEYAELVLQPALESLKEEAQEALAAISVEDRAEQAEASHVERIGGQQQGANAALQEYQAKKQKYLDQKSEVEALLTNANDLTELARVILYGPEFQKLKQDQETWNAITRINLPTEAHISPNQTISQSYIAIFNADQKDFYKRFVPDATEQLSEHYDIVEDSPAEDHE